MDLPGPARPALSEGEIACIRMLADGLTDAGMAAALRIAPATAHWRVEQAKKKLGARTRAQLIALAFDHGLVGREPTIRVDSI